MLVREESRELLIYVVQLVLTCITFLAQSILSRSQQPLFECRRAQSVRLVPLCHQLHQPVQIVHVHPVPCVLQPVHLKQGR